MKKLIFSAVFLIAVLFSNSIIEGRYPYPGDYQKAWYEPWRTEHSVGGGIGLPHKSVADDVIRQLYPYRHLTWQTLKAGKIALWNPYNGSGTPLLATMHAGILNPSGLVYGYLFDSPEAWRLLIITQVLFLVLAMYLYLVSIRLSDWSAIFGAVSIALSSFSISRLLYGEYIYIFACLPLSLAILEKSIRDKGNKVIFFLPFVVGYMVLSGQPQMIAYCLSLFLIYAGFRLYHIRKNFFQSYLKIFLLIMIGFLLGAVQLVPTIELYRLSNMTTQSSRAIIETFLMPLTHLISIAVPNYFGNPGTYNYWGYADYIETATGIGLIPVFFVIIALTSSYRQRRIIRLFAIITLCVIVLTIRSPVSKILYTLPMPLFSTGVPTRIFALLTFCLMVISSFGFDAFIELFQNNPTNVRRVLIVGIVLLTFVCFIGLVPYLGSFPCVKKEIINCRMVAFRNTITEVAGLFTLIVSIWIFSKRSYLKRIIPICIVSLVISIGTYSAFKFLPFSDRSSFHPASPVISQLQKIIREKHDRSFWLGEKTFKTDFAVSYALYDPQQYDPLSLKRYGELVAYANTGDLTKTMRSDIEITNVTTPSAEVKFRRDRLLDLVSSHYLVSTRDNNLQKGNNTVWQDANWTIATSSSSLPRAFVVYNYRVESDPQHILTTIFDPLFNPLTTVVLESEPTKIYATEGKGDISIQHYSENTVSLKAAIDGNGILVLTDTYYPGWHAYIDNKETPIIRANYAFRGIEVSAGDHDIIFSYEPLSYWFGLCISITTLILYSVFYIVIQHKASLSAQSTSKIRREA